MTLITVYEANKTSRNEMTEKHEECKEDETRLEPQFFCRLMRKPFNVLKSIPHIIVLNKIKTEKTILNVNMKFYIICLYYSLLVVPRVGRVFF